MPTASRAAATLLCLLALLTATAAPSHAAPAFPLKLDRSFGKRGVAEPDLGPRYGYTSFVSLSVQPDGSLLAARPLSSGSGWVTVHRYDAAGNPDPGFRPRSEDPPVEAVDADGRTLRVSGTVIERFNPDGTRDPGFGTDPTGGRPFSEILPFRIEELLPMPSGKIVAAGSIRTRNEDEEVVAQVVLARLDNQGRYDPGFGGDGVVELPSEAGVAGERLVGVVARAEEGLIVLVDEAPAPAYEGAEVTPGGSAVLALAADGRPDPGYGEGGAVRSPSSIEGFAALPGGALVLAGNRWGEAVGREGPRRSDFYAARLTPSGRYDPSFDGDGVATIDFGAIDLVGALLPGSDGSILIGGSSSDLDNRVCVDYEGFCRETPVLARLLPNGSPDPGFGADGRVRLDTLSEPFVQLSTGRGVLALVALPDGNVLAGGGSGNVAFIAKLDGRGALVTGFGRGGVKTERDPHASETEAHAVAIDRRHRILLAGSTDAGAVYSRERGVVFRFRRDGRLDRDYGAGRGYARVPGNTRDIALGPEGDAFVLSGKYAPNLVVHVTPRGLVDRRFGEDGVAPLPELPPVYRHGKRRWRYFDPRSIAALPGGGVLVGGEGGDDGPEARIVLVRFDRRGRLDRRFGKNGVAILALGRTGHCNLTQLKLRRDGRILIAGKVRERGENGRRPALFQLLSNGSPDPSFGHRGVVQVGRDREGMTSSLAIQRDGSVLLAAYQEAGERTERLLLRFSRHGVLDRRFARRMRASSSSLGLTVGFAPRRILPTRHGIFTVSPSAPLAAFSPGGTFRAALEFDRRREPRRHLTDGALQGGRLVLVGEVGWNRGLVLRRYLPR